MLDQESWSVAGNKDHVIVGFRPSASVAPENKERRHACSEVKLSAIFLGDRPANCSEESRKMQRLFISKAPWLETQVSGSLSLRADPDHQFKKWGLGSLFVPNFSWFSVT